MRKRNGLATSITILITGLSFLLFFLGYLSWDAVEGSESLDLYQEPIAEYSALILTILSVIFISYKNKSPVDGLIVGASISSTYWIGFLVRTVEIYRAPKWGLYSSIQAVRIYDSGALSSIIAFASMGMFFGLLGRIYDRLILEKPIEEVYVFRDYWSNVYSLGKNMRREISDLDQRYMFRVPINLRLGEWWTRITQQLTEVKPELIFNRVKKSSSESSILGVGEVYDIGSGKKIHEGLVDPLNLLSSYRPSILNMPSLSHSISGGRRLAFEELVSRFLGWFIGSRYLLILYFCISVLFSGSIVRYYSLNEGVDFGVITSPRDEVFLWDYQVMWVFYVIASCVIVSGVILFFIMKWRNLSSKLFLTRPDERTLIFTVYLCFLLAYWMSYQFIVQPPYIVQGGDFAGSWFVWTKWFQTLFFILGLSYIFIHRESEVSNIYLYDGRDADHSITSYRSKDDVPFWLAEEGEIFWVLRYMYYWPMELTLVPHSDWERIEVWVDAITGKARWVVSDYHYRELWYSVEDDLYNNHKAGFLVNFHTPIPIVKLEDVAVMNHSVKLPSKDLLLNVFTGKSGFSGFEEKTEFDWNSVHNSDWIELFGLFGPSADFCSKLKWTYWRYPWGIDNIEKYSTFPASQKIEQPLTTR
jgi:hypothetical protein